MAKFKLFFAIFSIVLICLMLFGRFYLSKQQSFNYIYQDFKLEPQDYNLLLGTSTIKRIDKLATCDGLTWLNRGFVNTHMAEIIFYIEHSKVESVRNILIYAGENHIRAFEEPEETSQLYIALINLLKSKYPDAHIVVVGIKPSPARAKLWDKFKRVNFNLRYQAEQEKQFTFYSNWSDEPASLNLFLDDGVHLNAQGYHYFFPIKELFC
ncbi:hypothetical protein N7931_07895 [Catenovulum sp. 2E275]|uniref:hypothetical protein n=1 Tax=Catenovulum sp. 2E275 TaxID=2980497 RepID=UPI0021CEAD91|nr:hypothetical protein [Catenovulum sp. 2E275]MCU4675557.1 hypothetical protein [Catenovulum sp. 2E275]